MKEKIVSNILSKKAKTKGFNYEVLGFFMIDHDECPPIDIEYCEFNEYEFPMKQFTELRNDFNSLEDTCGLEYISVPSQTQLQSWLREVHDIKVFVEPYCTGYKWRLYHSNMSEGEHGFRPHDTWENALEEGLLIGLNLIP